MEESQGASTGECTFDVSDDEYQTNLCCCYEIDADGNYVDPCYLPVEDCCCCDPMYE